MNIKRNSASPSSILTPFYTSLLSKRPLPLRRFVLKEEEETTDGEYESEADPEESDEEISFLPPESQNSYRSTESSSSKKKKRRRRRKESVRVESDSEASREPLGDAVHANRQQQRAKQHPMVGPMHNARYGRFKKKNKNKDKMAQTRQGSRKNEQEAATQKENNKGSDPEKKDADSEKKDADQDNDAVKKENEELKNRIEALKKREMLRDSGIKVPSSTEDSAMHGEVRRVPIRLSGNAASSSGMITS